MATIRILPYSCRAAAGRFPIASAILTLLGAVVSAAANGINYTALGVEAEANEIELQAAYKTLLTTYGKTRDSDDTSLDALVAGAKAYEALSDHTMQEEAMGFVDYWSEVTFLAGDYDLMQFSVIKPGGFGGLRVIFVTHRPDVKVFDAFSASLRLHGKAKVAQVCHRDMVDIRGRPSKFYASLKVYEGGVVIFDPLSRSSKVTYDISSVSEFTEQLVEGHIANSKLAKVQDLNTRTVSKRCGPADSKRCQWMLVVATDTSFERRRDDFMQVMRDTTDTCKALQVVEKYPWLACFWLHLGRSTEWKDAIAAHAPYPLDQNAAQPVVLAIHRSTGTFVVGPTPDMLTESPEGLRIDASGWFEAIVLTTPTSLHPQLPPPLRPDEEPEEGRTDILLRYYTVVMDCVTEVDCVVFVLNQGMLMAGITTPYSSDSDKQTMLALTAMAIVMLSIFFRRCCCCCCCLRRKQSIGASESIKQLQPIIPVALSRVSKDQKYGLAIERHPEGGLLITNVDPSGLVGRWNSTQQREAQKIKSGDRILAITCRLDGKEVASSESKAMTKAFAEDSLVLRVSLSRGEAEVARIVSTIEAGGKDITKKITLGEVPNCAGGQEVLGLSPEIEERNAQARSEGLCLSQIIEVGDFVVMAPGTKNVFVVKFRFLDQVRTDAFDVVVERSGPNDKLGMQVCACMDSPQHMEVLDVLEGAVANVCAKPGARKVLRGDRLVAVNGKNGGENMSAEFRSNRVVLSLERWVAADGTQPPAAAPSMADAAPPTFGAPQPPAVPPAASGVPPAAPASVPTAPAVPAMAAPPQFQQAAPFSAAPQLATAPVVAPTGAQGVASPSVPVPSVAAAPGTTASFAPAPVPRAPTPVAASSAGGCCESLTYALLLAALATWIAIFGREPPAAWAAWRVEPTLVIRIPASSRALLEPIHPQLYGDLAVFLIFIGVLFTIRFMAYEVTMRPHQKGLISQLCVASFASGALGFGVFFLLVWANVYS